MLTATRVVVRAPAKINLFLDIAGTAPNGYHLLDTVMHAVDLSETLLIECVPEPGIHILCEYPGVPEDSSNLAHRAAAAFIDVAAPRLTGGLKIRIDKVIPPQAGLGGGSADAAAALIGLDHLFGTNLSDEHLREIGLALGADVPFLLTGGCAHASGVGELLTPVAGLPSQCLAVIAKPAAGISTAFAYAAYDRLPAPIHQSSMPILAALAAGDLAAVGCTMFNAFEQILPDGETARIREIMLQCGGVGAALSGSGSAVAALFVSPDAANRCAQCLSGSVSQVFVAQPVHHGPQILQVD